ncbi:hypothetical protein K1719_028987 [Acacia pycnantha]|nr:hypothetical protein K1719_028987 [Acacia pycnantha]
MATSNHVRHGSILEKSQTHSSAGAGSPAGIMDPSNSKGKKEGLGAHAGYATKYGSDDHGSKGPDSSKGSTKKPNLAKAAGYHGI